jgi:hypothetical protein
LDSIDNHELLAHFEGISGDDPSAVVKKVLDLAKRALFDALGNVLEGEKDLRIVVNGLDKMRERGSDFIADVSTFIGHLGKKASGFKALLTGGLAEDSRTTLGGLPCLKIQYDKERKGLVALFLNGKARNVANKCRVP